MIVDIVEIRIKAGNGGNGAISFHREKYVNAGGRTAATGRGGDLWFEASDEMHIAYGFSLYEKFAAGNGENGSKKNMRGKNGEDMSR